MGSKNKKRNKNKQGNKGASKELWLIMDLPLSSYVFQFFSQTTQQGVNLWKFGMASFGFVIFLPTFSIVTGFISEKFRVPWLFY